MKYNAIKINPYERTISTVELEQDDLANIYRELSQPSAGIEVDLFTTFILGGPRDDALFIDDEGMFKDGERQAFFRVGMNPIAGNALIVGRDESGDSISPRLTIERVTDLFDKKVFTWMGEARDDAMLEQRRQTRRSADAMIAAGATVDMAPDGLSFVASMP